MIRSAFPITHLAELPARHRSQNRVSGFDFCFLLTAALIVVGGSFLMLDAAAAKSSGQESAVLRFLTDASIWLPALVKIAGKYSLYLIASVVNSALIVLLVQSLRGVDEQVSYRLKKFKLGGYTREKKSENICGKRAHVARMKASSQASPFLLSPVFR